MTAPPTNEKELWKALEARVNFDEEPSELAKFLGAHHNLSKRGNMTTGKVQMRAFLLDAVARHTAETGEKSLPAARTPYLPENFSPKGGEEPGALAKSCSSHLMKLLFASCLARPNLVVATTRLASKVTSWNRSHDRALRRLMQYMAHAADLELVGELSSEDLQTAVLVMSPDADLEILRSSGSENEEPPIFDLRGRNNEEPLHLPPSRPEERRTPPFLLLPTPPLDQ